MYYYFNLNLHIWSCRGFEMVDTPCKLNSSFFNGVFDEEERKWHVRMKIALHPPPPLIPPPILPWSYLTLFSIFLPSRFIFEDYTPTNFDTFPAAIMTVFQVWLLQIPPRSACSPWHIAPWDISHPRRRLNNSAHSPHPLPPLSSHTSMHTYGHMNKRQVKRERIHIRSATKTERAVKECFDQHT